MAQCSAWPLEGLLRVGSGVTWEGGTERFIPNGEEILNPGGGWKERRAGGGGEVGARPGCPQLGVGSGICPGLLV